MVRFGERPVVPKHQADATLSQDNPVSGTKYTVLDTTNARIIGIAIVCTWTAQPSPLEVHVIIDGQSIIHIKTNPASAASYYCSIILKNAEDNQGLHQTDIDTSQYKAFLYEGRSIKVEIEITGGTVSNLSGRVKYAKF